MVEIETEPVTKEKYEGQRGPCGTSRGWSAHKGVSGRDESGGPRSRHERLTADGAARSHYLADQPQSIIIIYSLHFFSPARSARAWGPIDRSAQVRNSLPQCISLIDKTRQVHDTGVSGRDEPRGPRSRHERLTADGAARFPSLLVDQPQSIHQFTFAALLLTCAIRTTLGAYRQVSPGSAWTRLRSHGRVGGALHLQRRRRRDSGSCTNKQHQRRRTGLMEAQFGGDKYVPDTEEVYWQRDPAESVEGERRQRHAESGGDAEGAVASTV